MSLEKTAYKTIATRAEGPRFTVTLDRPPLNILNLAMSEELAAAFAEASGSAFLVLDARGKAFSAGADVGDHLPERAGAMLKSFHAALRALAEFPGLSVACVHGAALGGGLELASAADLILASDAAGFGQPEILLGVFPPAAAALLPAILPPRVAAELVLTGRTLDAQEALRAGLVNQVFPAAEFPARVEERLGRWQKLSRSSLLLAKRTLRRLHPGEFARRLAEAERIYLDELLRTADGVEGCRAFLEKRPPAWRHA